jgi:hypothetical protein
MPRSIAESTFSLRSFEYAFMDLFLCRSAIYASRCKKPVKRKSNFFEFRHGEVRRIPPPRTRVNRGKNKGTNAARFTTDICVVRT